VQLYNNLQGLDVNGDQLIDPSNGEITTFMNSGDPIANTGWLDFYYTPPSDVYFMQASGGFDMAPGDTQRVIYAIVVGHDFNRFASILDLRKNVNFVQTSFSNEFAVKATATTELNNISSDEIELTLFAQVNSAVGVASIQSELYDYNNNLIQTIALFDDGQNNDVVAGDNIFTGRWQTHTSDDALYLNLKVVDVALNEHLFKYADYNITLSDKIAFNSLIVVDDNINYDNKINPGENIRLNFDFTNNYSFELERVSVIVETDDPYVQMQEEIVSFDSLAAGANAGLNYDLNEEVSYLVMNVAPDVPDTHTIYFDVTVFDNKFHEWHKTVSLKIEPFNCSPNRIIPTQTAGRGDAYFEISVINPVELTGHNYVISVSDSINESRQKGFNLIDQTSGVTLLSNHAAPDEYAYNIPITDGFKVVEAYLPDGGLKDVYYEGIEGGHPAGFEGVNFGGEFFNGGVKLGSANEESFCKVELEFINNIDTSGVVGAPGGQSAFRYEVGVTTPTGFFPCPFNVWKIVAGQRAGKLNACFQENPNFATYDDVWAPDNSAYGGFETLYIMASDYDATGQLYHGLKIDMKNVLYKANFRLASEIRVVDAGDKLIFDWENAATSEDEFTFIPTNVGEKFEFDLPKSFALFQNYPNPFNPTTTIKFSIDESSQVSLKIYNIMGQEIAQPFNRKANPGNYSAVWDGRNYNGNYVSSGLYFAKLFYQGKSKIIKMLLIR